MEVFVLQQCRLFDRKKKKKKSPMLFVKKSLCTGNLSPARKIFIEWPAASVYNKYVENMLTSSSNPQVEFKGNKKIFILKLA